MPSARARNRESSCSRAWTETHGATQIPLARISSRIVRRTFLLDLMTRSDMRHDDFNLGVFRLNGRGEREGLLFFTMDEKNLNWRRVDCPHVGKEIMALRVGREPVELYDLPPPWSGHAENRHDIPSFDEFAPEGMLGLKAHEDDHVRFVLNRMLEMMHDAPAFAHA